MTPKKIDENIKSLLKLVNASHEPGFLDVTPDIGVSVKDCFPAVQKKVKRDGGKMIMGWQIWITTYLVEAEAHAVWENLNGELVDITPKENGITKILFVEDENLAYEEKQIRNIRLNTTNNPLVDDLIKVCNAIFAFENKGDRATSYNLILSDIQANHLQYLKGLKDIINVLLKKKGTRKSPCVCGSSLPFSSCHGIDLQQKILYDF